MSGQADELKGRGKEAIGVLTDDKDLQREGQNDQVAGKTKNKLEDAKDWADDKIDDVNDKLNRKD